MTGSRTRTWGLLPLALLIATTGCGPAGHSAGPSSSSVVVGFGLGAGTTPEIGIHQAAANLALEPLVAASPRDGRPRPWLAEGWSLSADGLTYNVRLRPGVSFHDGTAVTAASVVDILASGLRRQLGPGYANVSGIRAVSETEIELSLKQRSAFFLDELDVRIQREGPLPIGTGPFSFIARDGPEIEMRANESYHGGKPLVDRVVLKPYESLRAAWADMLRGEVDVLYEVGPDALDSLQAATGMKTFKHARPYVFLAILNTRHPYLRDSGFRRLLNAAIDRDALVADALQGLGTPAQGPVWPDHWAVDPQADGFRYQPQHAAADGVRFTCIFSAPALERMALVLQKQLHAVGVETALEGLTADEMFGRLQSGTFDLALTYVISGPTLARPHAFWHSAGRYNWGGFSSRQVDAALDAIQRAPDDAAYKAGVAAFQRAIVDDPPAIFLAWRKLARAVSTRFEVPVEPERDVLSSLQSWRPLGGRPQPTGGDAQWR